MTLSAVLITTVMIHYTGTRILLQNIMWLQFAAQPILTGEAANIFFLVWMKACQSVGDITCYKLWLEWKPASVAPSMAHRGLFLCSKEKAYFDCVLLLGRQICLSIYMFSPITTKRICLDWQNIRFHQKTRRQSAYALLAWSKGRKKGGRLAKSSSMQFCLCCRQFGS